MANINEVIQSLGQSNFYVIAQEMSFDNGAFSESDKYCIGYFSGAKIKSEYVKLYRSAKIDGMKPTVKEFSGMHKGVSQKGLRIDSTEITYWILTDNHNWMDVYSAESKKSKTITDNDLEDNMAIVPSKGYTIVWNKESKLWDVSGFSRSGSTIYIGSTKYAKAIDLTWKVWASDGWHANVLRIDLEESPMPEDVVEVTNGERGDQRVISTEYGIFTSLGETYAKGYFSGTHKK